MNINIGELLNLINAYIPYIEYAGVKSEKGFTVTADQIKSDDSNSGSAGGFIGYGSGVQVSHCDVNNLKHTKVTAPKDLEEQSEAPILIQTKVLMLLLEQDMQVAILVIWISVLQHR